MHRMDIYVLFAVGVFLLPTFISAVSFYPNLPVHEGIYSFFLSFSSSCSSYYGYQCGMHAFF